MRQLLCATALASLTLAAGCGKSPKAAPADAPSNSAAEAPPPAPSASAPALRARVPERREGQAMVPGEDPSDKALYLADEDHKVLRRIVIDDALAAPPASASDTAPLEAREVTATESQLALPGAPAQVVSLGDRLLVTVRDPGLLLIVSAGPSMRELARVELPHDAWGIALAPDGGAAYVSCAWSRKLVKVELSGEKPRVAFTVDVAREPRGVAVSADSKRVYVTHLTGADVTVVDASSEPRVERVFLPPAPLETFVGEKLTATLGYAALLSPDGRRLFVARHAMGALWTWQGRTTVDVLATANNEPVAPVRKGKPLGHFTSDDLSRMSWLSDSAGTRAEADGSTWVQPRAMVYRKKTRHLLVASEGMSVLAELDAMSMQPGLITNRLYRLGGLVTDSLPKMKFPPRCGAPTAVALSADENVAWVYCRTTDNVVAVRLTPDGLRAHRSEITYLENGAFHDKLSPWGPFAVASLSAKNDDAELALGRRLFFDATDPVVSGHMACAGCHPEGRDDGHVWREQHDKRSNHVFFLAGPTLSFDANNDEKTPQNYGFARQTPMLAGRVDAEGPYGWHGESPTLIDRIKAGFGIHRVMSFDADGQTMRMRAAPIARYLREGLVKPPRLSRPLTEQESQGEAVFKQAKTRCVTCHPIEKDHTDRSVQPMVGFRTQPFFSEEKDISFKVPSLRYVGQTEPYYHDGSARTLDDLVERNMDRMGTTSHLSKQEKEALVAYLKTL